jgi:hypothetical protein
MTSGVGAGGLADGGAGAIRTPAVPKKILPGKLPGGLATRISFSSQSSLSDATVDASLSLLAMLHGLSAVTS